MARPPINTGSSALQAYMQGVANMGQVRAQMQANTTQAINALGDTFTKWQDDFNKRKHLKWTQQMEEAKLAESKRVNDSNIKVNEGNLALNQEAAPFINDLRKAQAAQANANAAETRRDTALKIRTVNEATKNGADYKTFLPTLTGSTPPAAAAANSNGVGTTGNATQLNIGGVPLGQNGSNEASSAMIISNNAKKQNNTATTNTNTNGYGATNYFNAINKGKA